MSALLGWVVFAKIIKVSIINLDIFLNNSYYSYQRLCNSNWTAWSAIQGVIARVISKLDERGARGRFEITSTITP